MTTNLRKAIKRHHARNNALYFPYINVPSSAWFTRLLLYWDKIGSIVPYEYTIHPEKLSPYMRELVAAELVEQIMPGAYIHSIPHFTESFLDYINNQRHAFTKALPHKAQTTVKLHIEKVSDDLAGELIRQGFARPLNYTWYEVNARVARAFMAYLATTLGAIPDVNSAPITNERESLLLLSGALPTRSHVIKRQIARTIILEKIMPVPDQVVSPDELARFKSIHGRLLSRFRERIEAKCIDFGNISDDAQLGERIDLFIRELNDDIQDIADKMKSKWPKVVFSGLFSVLGAGGALAGTQLDNIGAVSAGSVALVAAAYQAFDLAHEQRNVLQNPLAYAALVRRDFSISRK
jgi:hypothetical protein